MTLLLSAWTIGLILSLLALGVYISYRVFKFADITADGSITLRRGGGGVDAHARRRIRWPPAARRSSRAHWPASARAFCTRDSRSISCCPASW